MYCKYCGNMIQNNNSFCSNCGKPVSNNGPIQPPIFVQPWQNAVQPLEKHLLLSIFTLGIWHFMWIYKTTAFLNRGNPYPNRDTTKNLLLCIFIPLYQIVWFRQSAEIVNQIAAEHNIHSDLVSSCMIAGFFMPIVGSMLIQEKLNEIATLEMQKSNT